MDINNKITRRRFLQGAVAVAGMRVLSGCEPVEKWYRQWNARLKNYPPALLGLRGDSEGSTDILRQILQGKTYQLPKNDAEENYDLIVVGAGISGLASAYLYQKSRPDAKILILDNHDDFGGHARRHEFMHENRQFLSFGGSASLLAPKTFSADVRNLLSDIGVDINQLRGYFDDKLYTKHWGLEKGVFFNQVVFGRGSVVAQMPQVSFGQTFSAIEQFPLEIEEKNALKRLYQNPPDYWSGVTPAERQKLSNTLSYYDFLKHTVKLSNSTLAFLQDLSCEKWERSITAISVNEAHKLGCPGVQNLGLFAEITEEEPDIYRFPDGNASIARLLVRKLIPNCANGSTMEDIVNAKFDYEQLDIESQAVRLRLNSTAISIDNHLKSVSVYYLERDNKQIVRIQANKCIFAGHIGVGVRIISNLLPDQISAGESNIKIPSVCAKVLVKNALAFVKQGVHTVYAPTSPYYLMKLEEPINIGNYRTPSDPDRPIVIHMMRTATDLNAVDARTMYQNGRKKLIEQNYNQLKEEAVEQLKEFYQLADRDFEEEMIDIVINRWEYGKSYQYTELYDNNIASAQNTRALQRNRGNVYFAGADLNWKPTLANALEQATHAAMEVILNEKN